MSTAKTINQNKNISLRSAARVAGFGLLFMFISGIFASVADPTELFETSKTSLWKFRTNIVGDIMMLVFDVVAAAGLYFLLRPVSTIFSLLSAWFRLMHVAVYGAGIVNLLFVVALLNGGESLPQINSAQLDEQIMFFINGHDFAFKIGLVFFSFHFLILGYLILKSTYIPKFLGVLLLILGVGYLFNSMASFLMPNYTDYQWTIQLIVLGSALLGELSLCLWLLFRGNRIPEISNS